MGQGLSVSMHRAEITREKQAGCGRTESPAAFDYCYYLSMFIEW
jgi:hypothetical protein